MQHSNREQEKAMENVMLMGSGTGFTLGLSMMVFASSIAAYLA